MAANVSLDFANTTEHHGVSDTDDKFASYTKAVEWARRQGILTESHARRLLDGAPTLASLLTLKRLQKRCAA
ncbi:MAG: hypothetical protein M1274_03415 [Actinobacteria bacterium]|nr:hypothetical protein [Actinomycetota bacterium]